MPLFLSRTIKIDFASLDNNVINSLNNIGILNNDEYDEKLIESINRIFPDLLITEVEYVDNVPYFNQESINKSFGVVGDTENDIAIAYIILVPSASAGSRTGLIAQQYFPTLTNLMHKRNTIVGNETSNKPIIIINANNETYTPSNVLSIISTKFIFGTYYVDVFNRQPLDVLISSVGRNKLPTNINDYYDLVQSISKRSPMKFSYDSQTNTLSLFQGNLKDPGNGMTNEPYYYLMQVLPAMHLSSEINANIDDSVLIDWWSTYSQNNTNKNIEYFIEWIIKVLGKGEKTMQEIYFGSPGTGKSHEIENILIEKNIDSAKQVFRTTFHPEYSYSDFVGQIMPSRVFNASTNTYDVSYDFYEGIFTRALKRAYEDLDVDVYFVVEEMSRGNVASIFGDLFQLLDRFSSGVKKGWSKYEIRNERIASQIPQINNDIIKLPPNFHIFGTVNTSDQNVFTMDTAFKRRFQWKYILTTPVEDSSNSQPTTKGEKYLNNPILNFNFGNGLEYVYWTDFYGALNIFISDTRFLGLGEDKQIGQFFIDFINLDQSEIKGEIQNKLLNYIWSDIANSRNSRKTPIFNESVVTSFSSLYNAYNLDEPIFSHSFVEAYRNWLNNSL